MKRTICYLFTISTIYGCSSEDSLDSNIQHKYHNFSRINHTMTEISQCEQPKFDSNKVGKAQKVAATYIKRLAHYIMEQVNSSESLEGFPQTFTGNYSPDKFCFTAGKSPKTINAFAYTHNRTLKIELGLLQLAENDAQMASVIGHELAHIMMQHNGEYPPEVLEKIGATGNLSEKKQFLKKCLDGFKLTSHLNSLEIVYGEETAEVKQIQNLAAIQLSQTILRVFKKATLGDMIADCGRAQQIIALSKALPLENASSKGKLKGFETELEKINNNHGLQKALSSAETMKSIINTTMPYGPNAHINWQEQEADEVGFELLLRSRFTPEAMPWFYRKMLEKSGESIAECIAKEENIFPYRGSAVHPSLCFRYNDVRTREPKLHKEDYKHLLPEAVNSVVFPGKLEAVKKAISAIYKD